MIKKNVLMMAAGGLLLAGCSGTAAEVPQTVSTTVVQTSIVPTTVKATVTQTATSTTTATETETATVTVTTSSSEPEPTGQSDAVAVGKLAVSGGINITVKSFKVVESYEVDYNDEPSPATPRQGGKFIAVTGTVLNKTKAGIDLTCSFPIDARLADSTDANYEPIDELYKIAGNPECNDSLQPGFDDEMTWIFEVPTSAKITTFGFREVDLSSDEEFPFAIVKPGSDL